MTTRTIATLLLAILLAACTSVPLSGTTDLHKVRIAPTPEPQRYDINVFASPATGARIGTYEAVLARDIARAPLPSDKDALFTNTLHDRANLRLGAELDAAMRQVLIAAGIEVTTGDKPADATLVIEPLYAGYVDQPFRPFTPLVMVEVRLVAPDKGLLFRQRYTYSALPYLHDDVHLVPEARFTFKDEAALLGNATLAAEGLRAALPLIATNLTGKLARRD